MRWEEIGRGVTYWTTVSAMALQGPHQVAKASRTTTLLSVMADWKSALLFHVSNFSNNPLKRADIRSEIVDTHIDS
jgi:hypothetical protein